MFETRVLGLQLSLEEGQGLVPLAEILVQVDEAGINLMVVGESSGSFGQELCGSALSDRITSSVILQEVGVVELGDQVIRLCFSIAS